MPPQSSQPRAEHRAEEVNEQSEAPNRTHHQGCSEPRGAAGGECASSWTSLSLPATTARTTAWALKDVVAAGIGDDMGDHQSEPHMQQLPAFDHDPYRNADGDDRGEGTARIVTAPPVSATTNWMMIMAAMIVGLGGQAGIGCLRCLCCCVHTGTVPIVRHPSEELQEFSEVDYWRTLRTCPATCSRHPSGAAPARIRNPRRLGSAHEAARTHSRTSLSHRTLRRPFGRVGGRCRSRWPLLRQDLEVATNDPVLLFLPRNQQVHEGSGAHDQLDDLAIYGPSSYSKTRTG